MTTVVRRVLVVVMFVLSLSGIRPGGTQAQAASPAQPTQAEKAKARELYSRGQQLFREADYGAALNAFEDAYRAVPNPVVLLSIAECHVRMERYDEAIRTLTTYLEERPSAPDKPQVEAQIAALRQKPGVVTIASTPAGAHIFVDDQDTNQITPSDLELVPGDHKLALQAEGYERTEQVVSVSGGSRQSVALTLPEVAKPVVAEQATEAAPMPEEYERNYTPFWIATGIAGAGLVSGIVLGSLALKEKNSFDDAPSADKADKGERLALFADVSFGVAAVAGVTGIVLLFTSKKPVERDPSVSFAPAVGRGNVGLIGNLRF